MSRFLVVFAAVLAISLAAVAPGKEADEEWENFKIKFDKKYDDDSDSLRKLIYFYNQILYKQHNDQAKEGGHSYTVGTNEYSDMNTEEIREKMNGFNGMSNAHRTGSPFVAPPANVRLPASVDWRDQGVVTPVKNQGQCGSCWAFSSTGSLEAANARKTGNLVSLSEQNLVDCTQGKWGNSACGGGWMDNAFKYVKAVNGIDTERYYPYYARASGYCYFNPDPSDIGGHDDGYVDIPHGDENALLTAVATVGPVSVAIDASHPGFSGYRSGIYFDPQCSSQQLDHAVLVVGYGTENEQDYWLVKNSWGSSWGEEGYIKMARNRNNNCGIASMASYPTV